jgi:hypothetical protein
VNEIPNRSIVELEAAMFGEFGDQCAQSEISLLAPLHQPIVILAVIVFGL